MADDAWLVILSSGLRRAHRSEKEQGEQFRRSLRALVDRHKEKHL